MFLAAAYSAAATGRALAQRRLAGARAAPSAASTLRAAAEELWRCRSAAFVLAGVFSATIAAVPVALIA